MSLIHQALKKAQREQLLHDVRPGPYAPQPFAPRSSRRGLLFAAGLVLVLGVGAALSVFLSQASQPTPQSVQPQPAVKQAPVVAQQTAPRASLLQPAVPDRATPVASQVPSSPPPVASPAAPDPTKLSVAVENTAAEPSQPAEFARLPASASPPAVALEPPPPSRPAASPRLPSLTREQALTFFKRAVALQEAGDETQALPLLERAVSLDPGMKEAYNLLGNLYYHQGDFHAALEAYQQALTIDPRFTRARNNLGSTYLRLDAIDRAREELHKALQTDDAYGLAYYNLACVYARAGDSSAAAGYLQRAMQLEPEARSWALTDDDFARVRTTPELQRLLGPS